MTKVLGCYLWLAPMLFFLACQAGMDSHSFVVVSVWGLHVLGLIIYTILVDDGGFRRGWEVCEHARHQPPGPI
jgi:hypothetical protein